MIATRIGKVRRLVVAAKLSRESFAHWRAVGPGQAPDYRDGPYSKLVDLSATSRFLPRERFNSRHPWCSTAYTRRHSTTLTMRSPPEPPSRHRVPRSRTDRP